MPSVGQAVLSSWSVPPAASFALALTAVSYLRGWFLLHRARVPFVPAWRAMCFLLGLLTLWIALASPLDTFSAFLITAHMLQHMLLMMVAPPLLLLGAPLIPLLRGLPVFARREFAGPFLRWRFAVRIGHALTNLWVALVLMGVAMFAWHTPRLYELALASSSWHELEHACFFIASLIFWWPVVQPWPSRLHAPRWAIVPYLLVGDLQNTILSAILVFSDRVLYRSYAKMPRLFGLSAVHDQAASGAIMWVVGSMAFLVPAALIAVAWLSSQSAARVRRPQLMPVLDSRFRPVPLSVTRVWLNRRIDSRKREAITFVVLFAATGVGLAALASGTSDDDNQALRMRTASGPFAIAVFAAPGDLETGSSSFSVLVQDAKTLEVVQEATIELRAVQPQTARQTEIVRATSESENKLLQSADLNLPTTGDWQLLISVRRGRSAGELSLPLTVVPPSPDLAARWPYLVLFLLAFLLLFAYCRRHRSRRAITRSSSVPAIAGDKLELTRKAQ